MNNKKLYRFLIGTIIFSVLLLLVVGIVFIIHFSNRNLSHNLENWGQVGEYFGGIMSPILALINICIFTILTTSIQKLTEKNANTSIESSKKVALINLKYEELRHFRETMDFSIKEWETDVLNYDKIEHLLINYNTLEYRMLFLFPELKNSPINKTLRSYIINAISQLKANNAMAKTSYIPVVNTYGTLISKISEWVIN